LPFRELKLWPCLALVVLGAALLFSHLRASPRSPDEQAYLAWGLSFALEGKIAEPDGRSVSKSVPPLHTLMVGVAFKSLGVEAEVAQFVSVLGGALTVGVCFLIGYLLLGVRGGFLVALLLMTSGKGEIWEYSNRVLNDIFLVLWISCILLSSMAYVRWGSHWFALAMGLFLGLGFVTKESTLLAFPVIVTAFFIVGKPKGKRLLHFLLAMGLAGLIMAPLILHRYNAIKLRGQEEAPRYGLRAGNLGTLLDSGKWGFRGLEELADNILLRGMPSGPFRVIYGVSLLACPVLLWRRRAPKELMLPILLILIWIGVFQVFLHLPLTRRQLLPLFPAYNILAGFVLISSWLFFRSRFLAGGIHQKIVGFAGWAGILGLVLMNMPFQAWSKVTLGELFKSPEPGFLEKEAKQALACAPDAALIASNFDRTLYFVLKGKLPVLHMQAFHGQGSSKPSHPKQGKKQRRSEATEKAPEGDRAFVLPKPYAELPSPLYSIIFSPRGLDLHGSFTPIEDSWEVICKEKGFVVSRWRRGSQPG
jgi:4-amino-4-deoxy-L-arabinose transferase-like glycosyltransferase